MLDAIAHAQRSIRLQAMYLRLDESMNHLVEALFEAATRGVHIQLSFDFGYAIRGPFNQRLEAEAQARNEVAFRTFFERCTALNIHVVDNRPWHVGNSHPLPAELHPIRNALTHAMIVPVDHYDHRKILVVDDAIAITGGTNLARYYLYREAPDLNQKMDEEARMRAEQGLPEAWIKWQDGAVLLRGPIVTVMARHYDRVWQLLGGQVFDTPIAESAPVGRTDVQALWQRPGTPEISTAFKSLVETAKESVIVINPYITHTPALRALMSARRRGLRVVILYPGTYNDVSVARRLFERHLPALLAAGVEVYRYDQRMAHTKLYVVDARYVLAGSFNLNYRSFYHDFEFNVCVDDPALAADISARILSPGIAQSERILSASRRLNIADWLFQPFS